MDNLAFKYNRILLKVIAFAPFVAYAVYTFLNIDFNTIMQLFSYIGVILLLIFKKREDIRFPKYLILYFLFVAYVYFVDLYILNRSFKVIYLFKNPLVGGLNFAFIIENIPIKKRYFYSILKYSKYVLIIAVIVILLQQAINPNIFVLYHPEENDILTKSDNDNRLFSIYSWIGGLVSVGFGFVPVFLIILEDFDKKKKRIMAWLFMGLIFAFLTKARWIMLNTIPVFFLLFINHKDKAFRFLKLALIIPLIVFLSSFALHSVGIDLMGIVNERILEKNKTNMSETTASTRLLAFKVFDKLFWDKPVIGHGNVKYGMGGTGIQDYKMRKILKGKSSQIHVGYLALLYRYGIIGAFLFLTSLFLLLKRLYNNIKITGMWSPFLGVLGLVLANLTLVTFSIFEMGILIALVADRFYLHENTKTKKFMYA